MTLKEYLARNGLTFRAFSKVVDIDYSQLNRYANGVQLPSLENALKIKNATGGKVCLEDWF